MAKYTVTHSCGHEEMVNLCGSHDGRQRELDRLQSIQCRDCKRDAELAAVKQAAAAAGLPKLTGSEKQVAWAMRIRAEVLAKIASKRDEFAALGLRKGGGEEQVAKELELFDTAFGKLVSKTSAAWWIDNRHLPALSFLRHV